MGRGALKPSRIGKCRAHQISLSDWRDYGVVYGGLWSLAHLIEPKPREMTSPFHRIDSPSDVEAGNRARPRGAPAIELFLDMIADGARSEPKQIEAYRRDLDDYAAFLAAKGSALQVLPPTTLRLISRRS